MKYIKQFELYIDVDNMENYFNILNNYEYKIGDHVRIRGDIYKITAIDSSDKIRPYFISNWHIKSNGTGFWFNGDDFKLVPDYELDAEKYNM